MMFVGRTVWEVNQGREGDFIGVCRRSTEIHKRLGAVNVALIAHSTGPGHLMTYVLTFENGAGYGAFVDALASDSEWLALGREFVADPPARIVSSDTGTNLLS
ncbi:MAG TPA: hypothetical protein QF905_05630 [Acidimicrobiales bacterium]|nr:hypothetical protein [Actinomycetota bacterium]MDP6062712.1 hypothetical protein [Acidimicrobiales bacterium]HJL89797.1 hypothetical protein [Acidimicrobiales bacterium]HJO99790.1 hypothetical protein [Acidimicrobiales bacterium]|tara:strand:- start:19825 stop:20133 length:309 start_codon:yes stop_codon:yes gene_type:complete